MLTSEKDGMPPAVVQLSEVAGLSVSELTEIVRTAVYDRHPKPNSWTWIAELYDDKVIYEVSPRGNVDAPARYFQAPYTLDRSGVIKATLGEAVEVKRKTQYIPVNAGTQEALTEDADYELELHEAANAPATIDLKIIKPGWGSSGYYPADVLKEDGPTAWQAGTHMYLDHPTAQEAKDRPERSVKDLAAVTISDPVYQENGVKGPGLYAKASVMPQYKEVIKALAPHIGVSIRAAGAFKEGEADGRKGRVITKINQSPANSIDFVTKAGAGGQVIAIMESLRQNEAPPVVSSEQADTNTTLHQEADGMELQEAQERIVALESDLKAANDKTLEESTRADRAEGALAILEAQGEARKLMENVSLPAAAKTRVITKVSADPPIKEGKLDIEALTVAVEAEAKVEAEYLESLGVGGKVTDQGTASGDAPADAEVKESLAAGIGSFFNLDADAAKRAANGR